MTRLLRVLPEPWRSRFGAEINDAMAMSHKPLEDRVDLIRWGVRLRMEQTARKFMMAGTVFVVAGALSLAWAAGELNEGIAEIPRHWWSMLASFPFAIGVALLLIGVGHRQQTQDQPGGD